MDSLSLGLSEWKARESPDLRWAGAGWGGRGSRVGVWTCRG